MKATKWPAVAVLTAALASTALAQGATSPVAPRSGPAVTAAGGKVAVINTAIFAERIFELKSKAEQVTKKFEGRLAELKTMGQQIEAMQQDIRTKQSVVPPDKLQQMVDQMNQSQTSYKRKGEDLQSEMERESETAIKPIRQKLSDFVKKYAADRNIILILDLPGSAQSGTLAYFNQAIDITDDFVTEYNKANPVPGMTSATTPPVVPPSGGKPR